MTVLRIAAGIEKNFFMASNEFARDPSITPRAAKVYIYLISHREGWKVSVRSVAKATGLGKNTVAAALRDLEDAGFIDRQQLKDGSGQFAGTEYVVHQQRQVRQPCPKNGDTVDDNRNPKTGTRSDQQEQDESAGSDRYPKNGTPQNGTPFSGSHKKTNSLEDLLKKEEDKKLGFSSDDSELASERLAPHLNAARAAIQRAKKRHAA